MITSFKGKNRWLSNFWPAKVKCDMGIEYPTTEHAYQAYKTIDPVERIVISELSTPGKAKRAGRKVTMRENWDDVKLEFMTALLCQKFAGNEELRKKLLATESQMIVEGNTWGDIFWGVCGGEGENHLGRIIMEIRTELQK